MNAYEKGMTQLLIAQLGELLFCESKLVGTLDKMMHAATDERLKKLLNYHRQETLDHVTRLEAALAVLVERPKAHPCRGMEGLLEDGNWLLHTMRGTLTLDIALVNTVQKVEMVKIAAYRCLLRMAQHLGYVELVELCEGIVDEEVGAYEKFSRFARVMSPPGQVA